MPLQHDVQAHRVTHRAFMSQPQHASPRGQGEDQNAPPHQWLRAAEDRTTVSLTAGLRDPRLPSVGSTGNTLPTSVTCHLCHGPWVWGTKPYRRKSPTALPLLEVPTELEEWQAQGHALTWYHLFLPSPTHLQIRCVITVHLQRGTWWLLSCGNLPETAGLGRGRRWTAAPGPPPASRVALCGHIGTQV